MYTAATFSLQLLTNSTSLNLVRKISQEESLYTHLLNRTSLRFGRPGPAEDIAGTGFLQILSFLCRRRRPGSPLVMPVSAKTGAIVVFSEALFRQNLVLFWPARVK